MKDIKPFSFSPAGGTGLAEKFAASPAENLENPERKTEEQRERRTKFLKFSVWVKRQFHAPDKLFVTGQAKRKTENLPVFKIKKLF